MAFREKVKALLKVIKSIQDVEVMNVYMCVLVLVGGWQN